MYHCQLQIHLAGPFCTAFDLVQNAPPLERFTHSFTESASFSGSPKADLILANLLGVDLPHALGQLTAAKEPDTQLILLLDKDQLEQLTDLTVATDLWVMPMDSRELSFRFLRWQENCKRSKDAWLTDQYLEAVINGSPNMIWFKDKAGIHQKVNDGFCRIVNKPKSQVEGRDHCFIWNVGPEDAEVCARSDARVMDARKLFTAEEQVKAGDETKLFITYKSPLFDLDGSVMGTVGVGIDVTRERTYQQEITKKSHALEAIFTSLECGVLCHTVDGKRIISINNAALHILGYRSQKELMDAGFNMIAPSVLEEDQPLLRAAINSLKKEGDNTSFNYRVRHADGELLHVTGNIKLIRENGELYYQRFLLDCTEQRLQEQENERHHLNLTQALSMDYSLVCSFDVDSGEGVCLRVDERRNCLCDGLFSGGIHLTRTMNRYIDSMVFEEDRAMLRRALSPKNLKGKLARHPLYDVNYRTLSGNKLQYYEIRIVPVGDWKVCHEIVLGIRSVDERTRQEMAQKQLLEAALVEANRASQAKTAFLSNMSHDIRTPMNAIIGFTSLAIAHIDRPDQVEEYLHKIMASGNHMLNLINDVLDMSRIESGKMQLEANACDLTDVVSELADIVRSNLDAKGQSLELDLKRLTNQQVFCDKLRLSQVLLNVLSNAIKYTGDGGHITLRLIQSAAVRPQYAKYTFQIIDDGIGMSKEFVSHIFEPFEREKNTTASGIQGTGLGMAITKNIVDMMKGSIAVNSRQNKGTKVTITFAFLLSDQPAPTPSLFQSSGKHADGQEDSTLHHKRLLLVEDNELNQEIALAILEDAGFQVELAENGKRALEMLQASQPGYYSLILMDVQMPVMNGYEATRAIRALPDPALSAIPILAMTANAFEEDKQEALKAGMNGHIAKPIDVDKLFSVIDSLLA